MNTFQSNLVENKLRALHHDARHDYLRISKVAVKSIFRPMQPADFKNAYLPISAAQGKSLKSLILKNNCQNVVEFGTSFGISTIYLADAVRQTNGKVVTTELLENKAQKAAQNIAEAGLSNVVEIRIGDAMQTLKDYDQPIDLLFLDGWKDLYLPLFEMLQPLFHSGTFIYADNMDMAGTKQYADYVLTKRSEYATRSVDDGKAFLTVVL
ncbi:MAG: O-methyltransferase [Saprospiraceae bacterium]